uniref:hypothetical protein n=1 Tax=Algoriphagus sp. TaxID=1872435 RepID=UPI0040474924
GAGAYCFDLVRDKQCNGVSATAAQIYSAPASYSSLPNPFEETRFQFLKRVESYNPAQQYAQGVGGGGAPTFPECSISFLKKCSMVVEYNATTGAVSDLTSDNVQLYCNNTNVGQGVRRITNGTIRVLYTDA